MSPTLAALALAQALHFAQAAAPSAADRAEPAHDEPVVAVRPSENHPTSFWSRAKGAVGRTVRRLWEKDEPHSTDGNLASLNGNVDEALKDYDEAEHALPPGGDAAATLAFDRSTALLKGSPEQAKKALEEAQAARDSSDPSLRAKAAYNTGVALEAQGKPDEAIKAYANALSLDPEDVDSKVNLELLLQEHQKKQPQAGQQQDKDKQPQPKDEKDKQEQQAQGKQDDKKDQQQQQQKQGEQKKDEQKKSEQQQAKEDEKKKQEQQGQQEEQQGESEKKQKEEQPQASLGRSEAQRLLDAARAGEKNLQMWRFGKKAEQHKPRTSAEKDW